MQWKLKIGVVEPDEEYARHLVGVLEQNPAVADLRCWSSAEAFRRDNPSEIDLLLVDMLLPRGAGLELARRIPERYPDTRVVLLTAQANEDLILESLSSGAAGYLLKSEIKDLNESVQEIMDGGAVLTPTIAFRVLQTFKKETPRDHSLTSRELQILQAMASGMAPRKTAEYFRLSEKTVRAHVRNIYRKLNVNNQIELMKKIHDLGLG